MSIREFSRRSSSLLKRVNVQHVNTRTSHVSARQRPASVQIVEVGPRDGLQNERLLVPTEAKLGLIHRLEDAGLRRIEAGSFVSPEWVPQMADTPDIFKHLSSSSGSSRGNRTVFSALTPNLQGFDAAYSLGVDEVAIFGSASESFSQTNINCSVEVSMRRFKGVCDAAKAAGIPVRGYVSCVLGCPYEGDVAPERVVQVAKQLLEMGCFEISLGDTIGVGTPGSTQALLSAITKEIPPEKLAVHFHDTFGMAVANILVALDHGINVVDSSVSGLGGCPYAKGASGNVATEDVVYLCEGLGISTGVDMPKLLEAQTFIDSVLGRKTKSRVAQALGEASAAQAQALVMEEEERRRA